MPDSPPIADTKAYYVGFNGEQSGPYSGEQVVSQIVKALIPEDALIWHEGLKEWVAIDTIQAFKLALAQPKTAVANSPAVAETSKPGSRSVQRVAAMPSVENYGRVATPVFSRDEADLSGSYFVRHRMRVIGIGLGSVAIVLAALFILTSLKVGSKGSSNAAKKPPVIKLTREERLRVALSELQLKPDVTIAALKSLVTEKNDDQVGLEAVQAAVDYFKQNQKKIEMGKWYLMAGQPEKAVPLLESEPTAANDYELALQGSVAKTSGNLKRDFMLQYISFLVAPNRGLDKAIKQIHEFESSFPGEPHPFAYYLKGPEQKISDIFSRLSSYYIEEMILFLGAEFPQLRLIERPVVEIRRENPKAYRLVGIYQGTVAMEREKVNNIQLITWYTRSGWNLAFTNITPERSQYVDQQRGKIEALFSPDEILSILENQFQTKFPKLALHESMAVPVRTPAAK